MERGLCRARCDLSGCAACFKLQTTNRSRQIRVWSGERTATNLLFKAVALAAASDWQKVPNDSFSFSRSQIRSFVKLKTHRYCHFQRNTRWPCQLYKPSFSSTTLCPSVTVIHLKSKHGYYSVFNNDFQVIIVMYGPTHTGTNIRSRHRHKVWQRSASYLLSHDRSIPFSQIHTETHTHTHARARAHTRSPSLAALYIVTLSPWQLTETGDSSLGCVQTLIMAMALSQQYGERERQRERGLSLLEQRAVNSQYVCVFDCESQGKRKEKLPNLQSLSWLFGNHGNLDLDLIEEKVLSLYAPGCVSLLVWSNMNVMSTCRIHSMWGFWQTLQTCFCLMTKCLLVSTSYMGLWSCSGPSDCNQL